MQICSPGNKDRKEKRDKVEAQWNVNGGSQQAATIGQYDKVEAQWNVNVLDLL